jgi:hypothetical protein
MYRKRAAECTQDLAESEKKGLYKGVRERFVSGIRQGSYQGIRFSGAARWLGSDPASAAGLLGQRLKPTLVSV